MQSDEQPGGTRNKRAVNWLTKQTAATITKRTAGTEGRRVEGTEAARKRTCFFSARAIAGGEGEGDWRGYGGF